MDVKKATELLKLGDRVKIRHSGFSGRIIELRGPLGPGGVEVYRVRVRGTVKPKYIELLGDQLIILPTSNKKASEALSGEAPEVKK